MENQVTAQLEQLTEEIKLPSTQEGRHKPMPANGPAPVANLRQHTEVTKKTQGAGKAVAVGAGADDDAPLSIVDQLYKNFVNIFGNSNPLQVFSLVWPGTTLDAASYASDMSKPGPLPASIEIAQSMLFDQYYPVATITQPDGTRVSDRYQQALDHYGPVPNAALLKLQELIRERLAQPTTATVDGKTVTMSLLDKFNLLYGAWVEKREKWSRLKTAELTTLQNSGDANWWDEYITWYENNAGSYIDDINASYDRLLAEFPLNAFEDAIAILDTHEAAALLRAKQDIRNAPLPVPTQIGTEFVVATAIPRDWGNSLVPSTKFTDLLADPAAQQRYLDLCVTQLTQQIAAWSAVLAQMPPSTSKDDMDKALADFNAASTNYRTTTSGLITTYTANVVTAVKIYMQTMGGGVITESANAATDVVAETNTLIEGLTGTKGTLDATTWDKAATDIKAGMDDLNASTQNMVGAGTELGNKATAFLQTKVAEGLRDMIAPVLAQLTSQLTALKQQISNFSSSAFRTQQLQAENAAQTANPNAVITPAAFPSTTDSALNQRWTEVTLQVTTEDMKTASSTSTSFEQTNWSVDLFFGSGGGSSQTSSEQFASSYLDDKSTIQIGMLATKVLIERPWMHPEIFNLSQKFYRVIDEPVTTPANPPANGWVRPALVAEKVGGGADDGTAATNCAAINRGMFPAYPVAVLLVKDVTIKISTSYDKTNALQSYSQSNSSQGGGFLCFSTSKEQSSSASSKSVNSYAMAGDYVFRVPAPQVAGVWLQITPDDNSQVLTMEEAEDIAKMLGFVNNLKSIADGGRLVKETPQPQS